MRVLVWILLVFCAGSALKSLCTMLMGEYAFTRFFSLFSFGIDAGAVYVCLTYLYFALSPLRWMIIALAIINGLYAIGSLAKDEPAERLCSVLTRAFYCVAFIFIL